MRNLRVVLALSLLVAFCSQALAEDLTFSGKKGAAKWADYLNSNLARKVNDPKAQYWEVKPKGNAIMMKRFPEAKKPGRVMILTAPAPKPGNYTIGPGAKGDGEITFILAPGSHTGFRCRITVPQVSIVSLGAGYLDMKSPLEKPVFYVKAAGQDKPVLSKDPLPVKPDDKYVIASPVGLRITRKGGTVTFSYAPSYDPEKETKFITLHKTDIGADAPAFFGIDDFENPATIEEYLLQKITIKGLVKNK